MIKSMVLSGREAKGVIGWKTELVKPEYPIQGGLTRQLGIKA